MAEYYTPDNYGNAGSGSTDLGPADSPTPHKDTGEAGGAPDSGALDAFGGIQHSRTIHRAKVSQSVSIDRPGYPMAGEAASGT